MERMIKSYILAFIVVIVFGGMLLTACDKSDDTSNPLTKTPVTPNIAEGVLQSNTSVLNEAEEDAIREIVFSNEDIVELINEREYTIRDTGPWFNPDPSEKVGGFIEIIFTEAFYIDREWPSVGYEGASESSPGKGDYIAGSYREALMLKSLNVRVDLRIGQVVDITPLPFG